MFSNKFSRPPATSVDMFTIRRQITVPRAFSYHELELVRSRRRALLLTFVKWPAISRRQTFVYLELDELARALLVDESDGENDADNLKL